MPSSINKALRFAARSQSGVPSAPASSYSCSTSRFLPMSVTSRRFRTQRVLVMVTRTGMMLCRVVCDRGSFSPSSATSEEGKGARGRRRRGEAKRSRMGSKGGGEAGARGGEEGGEEGWKGGGDSSMG